MFLVRGRNSRGGKAFLSPGNESPGAGGPPGPQPCLADINSKTETKHHLDSDPRDFGRQSKQEARSSRQGDLWPLFHA